jgi:hypothetical protein
MKRKKVAIVIMVVLLTGMIFMGTSSGQQDMTPIINGVWRVQVDYGLGPQNFLANWKWDPARGVFNEGAFYEGDWRAALSGNQLSASSKNPVHGADQILFIQFISPSEAVGRILVGRGGDQYPAISGAIRATKMR